MNKCILTSIPMISIISIILSKEVCIYYDKIRVHRNQLSS